MARGHIRQRGEKSWELKFDAGRDPATGKRKIQYHSFKGNKREAQVKLAELIASVGNSTYMEPSKLTVADHVRARIDQWQASGDITARTARGYRMLAENQIIPHIGGGTLQKLSVPDIEAWHSDLRGSVTARTIGHAHRVLSKALSDAERHGIIHRNVCRLQRPPKPVDEEMVIVRDIEDFIARLPKDHRLYEIAMTALFSGMRLGEILALRWNRVDLDAGVFRVHEALQEVDGSVTFKTPKTRAGRRDISMPDILVETLREHRKSVLELRMKLGAGRMPDDALLFADLEGQPLNPKSVSNRWADVAKAIGVGEITFHALRHTHASQLIAAGVDIVTISKRLGHAKPDITLRTYAHLFAVDDSKAAEAINAAFAKT